MAACIKILPNIANITKNQTLKCLTLILSKNYCCDSKKDAELKEVTHTGQVWDSDDYRNVRFINSTRYVNKNFGIKLVDEVPPMKCKERIVYCDGGSEDLGHPKIFINLDKPGPHACIYCGLRFEKDNSH